MAYYTADRTTGTLTLHKDGCRFVPAHTLGHAAAEILGSAKPKSGGASSISPSSRSMP